MHCVVVDVCNVLTIERYGLCVDPDLWKKWLAKLEEKNFFSDLPVGSEEHTARTKKALAKFKEKFGDVKKPAAAVSIAPCFRTSP